MGQRRKRLIIQADITSESDPEFLRWVKALRRRRRLAEEVREGLRLRYAQATGRAVAAAPESEAGEVDVGPVVIRPAAQDEASTADRLKNLVQRF
ncbi:MAG TPA: hypothetical protein VGK74_24725 [Symbiobacteriaceae bacterium]